MLYGSLAGGYGYGLGFESDGGQATWQLGVDGLLAPLRNGISLQVINVSGHTDSDVWCAHPVEINVDVGMIANYNPSGAGGLLHTGVFRDVTDSRWKFFDGYDSALDSSSVEINTANAGFSLADIQFGTAYGALSGNASTATTAGALTTGRTIAMSGDITASGVSFDGTAGITLTSAITAGSIINADINASAAIVDTKLATISTAGKVQNGATTATSANTGSAIVARDASGNFSAGTVTAALAGDVTTTIVKFNDSDASNWVALASPHNPFGANVTWTLPSADGTSGQALVTDGTGHMSWAAAGATIDTDNATNTNFNLYFAAGTSGALTAVKRDAGLHYNPSSGAITADTFVGSLTGNTAGTHTGAVTTTIVKFNDSDASNWVAFSGPHSPAANVTWTLPNADGSSGQALVTNGGGTLSWAAAGAVTTVDEATDTDFLIHFDGTTSGAVTAIKHDTGLTYNPSTGRLTSASYGGNVVGNVTGNVTGDVSGSAGTVTSIAEHDTDDLAEGATNLYTTAARGRSYVSVTDAGGDGSLAYNSGTGVITYTGPSASEVRAHITASTGISITSGAVSNTGVLTVNGVAGSVTAANLLTALLTVDGAASTLDADLLDGQHGAYYRINVYNAAGTLLN
jgi:hypothetical protein